MIRRWPDLDSIVELIAFGAGLHAGGYIVLRAFNTPEGQEMWALFLGGSVTLAASARGTWKCLRQVTRARWDQLGSQWDEPGRKWGQPPPPAP